MIYDAAMSITLTPGFQATAGCTFRAVIDGCRGGVQSRPSPDEQEWIKEAEQHQQNPQGQATIHKTASAGQVVAVSITPNPFTTATTLTYTLPTAQTVDLQIFNAMGTLVAQPVRQAQQSAGQHEYTFEAGDLPPGVYFLVLRNGGQKQTKRLVLSQ